MSSAPRFAMRHQRAARAGGVDRGEPYVRRTLPAPAAFDRDEHRGLGRAEHVLLFGGQLHHAHRLVGIAQRCENLAADAEVGVALVRLLDRFWQGERRRENRPESCGLRRDACQVQTCCAVHDQIFHRFRRSAVSFFRSPR
jgi:hypothetical protein